MSRLVVLAGVAIAHIHAPHDEEGEVARFLLQLRCGNALLGRCREALLRQRLPQRSLGRLVPGGRQGRLGVDPVFWASIQSSMKFAARAVILKALLEEVQ